MKVQLIFAWYDLWIGLFFDKKKRWIYIFILPTLGIILKLKHKCPECGKKLLYSKTREYCSKHYCYDCYKQEIYFDEEYR